ncbi:hypothetical protein DRO53_01930 [Candidatus Bathyarchaeota archaeon]|nr:MAG: hypothetical protein DRO53_01930 [Candidatus Bathyarchaeota archaeon]
MKWKVTLNFPLDWKLKLAFNLLPQRPTPAMISGGKWFRAFRLKGKLIPVIVEGLEEKGRPVIVFTTPRVDSQLKREITRMVFRLHGLADPSSLHRFMAGDQVLRRILRSLRGFARAGLMAAEPFEGLVKAVIQQQIAFRVAEHLTANLVERFGRHVCFQGLKVYGFPTPERLAEASIGQLKECGLSSRKAEYIREIAVKTVKGEIDLQSLQGKSVNEVMEVLTSLKGVGRWTAELFMATILGFNVVPADDLGVRRAASKYFFGGKLQPAEAVRRFLRERFGDYQRDVTVYLLMAYRLNL